jgi:hypothetical protein
MANALHESKLSGALKNRYTAPMKHFASRVAAAIMLAAAALALAATPAAAQYSSSYNSGAPNSLATLGASQGGAGDGQSVTTLARAAAKCTGEYRTVAMCGLKAVLVRGFTLDRAEISVLKPTHGPQLGDNVACVRIFGVNGEAYFAVFFEDGKFLDTRRGVALDECQAEAYTPAPQPPKAALASTGRSGKRRPR